MLVVSWFIGCAIGFFVRCYLFCKFTNRNFNIDLRMIFFSIINGLIYTIITQYVDSNYIYIRPYLLQIYMLLYLLIALRMAGVTPLYVLVRFLFSLLSISKPLLLT